MISKVYTAFLVLENGCKYKGWSFISSYGSYGEIVFNTGMTGYQEIMTDPSYCDQIVALTYPEIGNTGVNFCDLESNLVHLKGLIMKSICFYPSNWMTTMSLPDYLVKYKIPHIFGIDTRGLTKQLRNQGVMLAYIASLSPDQLFVKSKLASLKLQRSVHSVDKVTTRKLYSWSNKFYHGIYYKSKNISFSSTGVLNVIVLDYGLKFSILEKLKSYGCKLVVVPAHTSCDLILAQKPDGVVLSNGPGDPSLLNYDIENIRQIVKSNIPVFGICLGHQLLGLAAGARTSKLRFGHRGLNHPSGTLAMAKMTSQNHGYVVEDVSPKSVLSVYCKNLNDLTVAGIVHKSKPCFSVQYHPEANPGPNDSEYLFAYFASVMTSCKLANLY